MHMMFFVIVATLFLVGAGDRLLGCTAPLAAQWMGAAFFTVSLATTLYAADAIPQHLAEGNSQDPDQIRRRCFDCTVALSGLLILYVSVLLVVLLAAYNTHGFLHPYGILIGALTIGIGTTAVHFYVMIGNVERPLDEAKNRQYAIEQQKREKMVTLLSTLSEDQWRDLVNRSE